MNAITARQTEILRLIARFQSQHGYTPTLRDLMRQLELKSTNGMNDHLKALEKKGYISRDPMKARAIRILRLPSEE